MDAVVTCSAESVSALSWTGDPGRRRAVQNRVAPRIYLQVKTAVGDVRSLGADANIRGGAAVDYSQGSDDIGCRGKATVEADAERLRPAGSAVFAVSRILLSKFAYKANDDVQNPLF